MYHFEKPPVSLSYTKSACVFCDCRKPYDALIQGSGDSAILNKSKLAVVCLELLAFALGGCATTVAVTPRAPRATQPNCEMHALVRYDGNPDYLPTVLVRDAAASQGVILRYRFDQDHAAVAELLGAPIATRIASVN